MKQGKSSRAWMREHVTDTYVQRAKAEGYRSRAAYKLLEIDEQEHLLRPGARVVDLGAAPGSWSQVARQRLGPGGTLVGVDLLPVQPLPGALFVQADLSSDEGLAAVEAALEGQAVDLVLSDMAPNLSGIAGVDQARVFELAELALDFAVRHLKPEGAFLVKLFQGADFAAFRKAMEAAFEKVVLRKPKASRDRSPELYLLGRRPRSRSL